MRGIVDDALDTGMTGAMGATVNISVLAFSPVPEDTAAAFATNRCK